MLRTSRAHDIYRRWFVSPLAKLCLRAGIRETELSLAAVLLAVAGAMAFVFEPAFGGALYLMSGAVDSLDGAVSRESKRATRAGAFLDSGLDRYAEMVILLGALGFYARMGLLTTSLALVVVLAGYGSWMVSYAQARAEGLGSSCSFGLFERPERILLLALGAITSPWVEIRLPLPDFLGTRPVLGTALLVLAAGANVTALRRLVRGYGELKREDEPSGVIDQVAAYLAARFPSHESTREWEPSRRVMVFRLSRGGTTMLVELSSEAIAEGRASVWAERLERWGLPAELREHLRVLVTPSGLEALPWKQLAPEVPAVDEELAETFPASDPSSRSAVSSEEVDRKQS